MKKILLLNLSIIAFGSIIAQQPSQKLDVLQKDPTQKERAAKADVRGAKDQRIFDSTSVGKSASDKTSKRTGKRKACGNKKIGK